MGIIKDDIAYMITNEMYKHIKKINYEKQNNDTKITTHTHTSWFLCLLPETFLKDFLFFQSKQFLGFALRMTFRTVVFGKHTIAFCVEDNERLHAV